MPSILDSKPFMRCSPVAARTAGIPLFVAVFLAMSGCGSSRTGGDEPKTVLTPADFASDPGSIPAQGAPEQEPASVVPAPTAAAPADVIVLAGAPALPAPASQAVPIGTTPALREVLVDQLAGQINGRPIYADEFFEPMDARFRREASRLGRREFIAFAKKEVEAALWDKLRDDLLLSEFEGSLTPEQKQGVLAFIETVRSDLISGNLGVESLADQRLREAEGLGLEQKVEDITQRRFILEQLRKAIGGRINVSAFDVRLYYEQNINDYIPLPVAKFTILRIATRDADRLAEAESALARGEAFEMAAARWSSWRPDAGNRHEIELKERDYAKATLFGPAPLNEAARQLATGQTTQRIDLRGDAYWIRLDAIDQAPGKTLYEVQTEIEQTIRGRRQREEEIRYFEQLFARGSFSDVKEMVEKLLVFAGERYLVADAASRTGAPAEN